MLPATRKVLSGETENLTLCVPLHLEQFLKMLGGAASPCALVCIGLFLADQGRVAAAQCSSRQIGSSNQLQILILSAVKLLLQPALTLGLANWLIPLVTPGASQLGQMAVLLAALPTGTGPFMLAEYYRRDGGIASKVILWTTIASIAVLAGWMVLLEIQPL